MARSSSIYELTSSELHEVYVPTSEVVEGGEVIEAEYVPHPDVSWVRGGTIVRTVRSGFYMHWADEVFDRQLRLSCDEEVDFYVITFALEGHWQEVAGGRRRSSYDRYTGSMALLRYCQSSEHRAMPTAHGKKARHLTLAIEGSQFRQWLTEKELREHPLLVRFFRGDGDPCLIAPITPRARLVVEQIQTCPFQGACRALFMEARCLDLILEMIHALQPQPTAMTRRLNPQDLERIHAVAEFLRQSLDEPPTLAELASRFSLSESKLKAGFHQVFGTTTFGYLRQQRLQKARALLANGECSILDASHMVGINNPSHFASLFKQHFGVNPKQFQLNATRQK